MYKKLAEIDAWIDGSGLKLKKQRETMYKKGELVEIVSDPYQGMIGEKIVGKKAVVTSSGDKIIGLRLLEDKMSVACWMTEDNYGCSTLKKV
jgi:hypothetical protein